MLPRLHGQWQRSWRVGPVMMGVTTGNYWIFSSNLFFMSCALRQLSDTMEEDKAVPGNEERIQNWMGTTGEVEEIFSVKGVKR
jgi:hypothetical protein